MEPEVTGGEPVVEPEVQPQAPVETPAAEPDAEDAEWDEATKEMFPDAKKGKDKEANKDKDDEEDEPAKPGEKPKTPKASEKGKGTPAETAEQKAAREAAAEDLEEEDGAPDTSVRDARLATREYEQQVAAVKSDIRTKMFAAIPTQLADKDGDPIRGIDDVMKLVNPRTGVAFTEEEAGMWFLSAKQQFDQNSAAIENQIAQIAEVNLDLKRSSRHYQI